MSHLNINGVDKPLDHIRLNNVRSENLFDIRKVSSVFSVSGDTIAKGATAYNVDLFSGSSGASTPLSRDRSMILSEGYYTLCYDSQHSSGNDIITIVICSYDSETMSPEKTYYNKPSGFTFELSSKSYLSMRVSRNIETTIVKLSMNTGSTALPYQPYLITKEAWEARTRVILHGLTNPLCGIGTYKDTLDLSTGTVTRYVKKLVLTGEEEYMMYSGGTGVGLRLTVADMRIPSSTSQREEGYCTHFVPTTAPSGATGDNITFGTSANVIYIVLSVASQQALNVTDFDDFKAWIATQYSAGHPVTVWYVLATPETEQITVPSTLTGIVEGYLTQSSTPSPTSPVYPTANGTPEQGGTYSLDTGAYAIAWGRADTFTGTNSITARCYGLPVKSWEIDGNSQQSGVPAPDDPIMPTFCGVRTENLYDYQKSFDPDVISYNDYFTYYLLALQPNTAYTAYTNCESKIKSNAANTTTFIIVPDEMTFSTANGGVYKNTPMTFTTQNSGLVKIGIRVLDDSSDPIPVYQESDFANGDQWLMLNTGSTALPYEPFGWAIEIEVT